MPPPKRPLTDDEIDRLRSALPPDVRGILDGIETVSPSCWNCAHFRADALCKVWQEEVPMTKRRGAKECWEYDSVPF